MSVHGWMPGWIAVDVALRTRQAVGTFHWSEWPAFCRASGVHVATRQLPPSVPAFRAGHVIFVTVGLSERDRALAIWHELAHMLLHCGGWEFWDGLPWGHLVLGKQERQADELALLLPDWSGF